ncbi:hypothetical protein [Paraburkholderia caribensis]|uniref:hypothetical protein n=1 Tax=Paraburkholderia caribensis TaxID=75105 RepID=UPI00285E3773|nr:hypothetical protein [Paraburkholderia caribensis]MDR6384948.1 hypothetical protein [Paraburkholderia caribensis]
MSEPAGTAAAIRDTCAIMYWPILKTLPCSHPASPLHRIGDVAYWRTEGCACCAHVRLLVVGALAGALAATIVLLV